MPSIWSLWRPHLQPHLSSSPACSMCSPLQLASLCVCSFPWWMCHSPGISSILGFSFKLRLRLHCFMKWLPCKESNSETHWVASEAFSSLGINLHQSLTCMFSDLQNDHCMNITAKFCHQFKYSLVTSTIAIVQLLNDLLDFQHQIGISETPSTLNWAISNMWMASTELPDPLLCKPT